MFNDLYLESIGEESVVEESVGDDELDHDNDEVEELTENETTKVNIVSEMKMFIIKADSEFKVAAYLL